MNHDLEYTNNYLIRAIEVKLLILRLYANVFPVRMKSLSFYIRVYTTHVCVILSQSPDDFSNHTESEWR